MKGDVGRPAVRNKSRTRAQLGYVARVSVFLLANPLVDASPRRLFNGKKRELFENCPDPVQALSR